LSGDCCFVATGIWYVLDGGPTRVPGVMSDMIKLANESEQIDATLDEPPSNCALTFVDRIKSLRTSVDDGLDDEISVTASTVSAAIALARQAKDEARRARLAWFDPSVSADANGRAFLAWRNDDTQVLAIVDGVRADSILTVFTKVNSAPSKERLDVRAAVELIVNQFQPLSNGQAA